MTADRAGALRRPARTAGLLLLLSSLWAPPLGAAGWITTGSLNTARADGIGILLHTGKVLVMAGAPSTQNTSELYDPATGVWTPAASIGPPGRFFFAAVLLRDGRVLVAGGAIGGGETATCRLYDPLTNSWTAAGSMGAARAEFTLTLLRDGRVLAAGGWSPSTTQLSSAEIFSLGSNSWSPTGPLTAPKARHTATLLQDGKVMVTGGETTGGVDTRITEVFDASSGTWTRVGDLATARNWHSATSLPNGKVVVAGGFGVDTAEIFDPGSGSWSATGSLPQWRAQHSATLLPNGRVLVAGGTTGGPPVASTLVFDPGTGNWTPGPGMAFGRARHSSTMLPDGRVLVAGSDSPIAATAELLDIDNPAWIAGPNLTAAPGRRELSLTLLKNGKVLAAGGVGLDTAEVYDPGAGSWTPTVNNMSGVRYRHTATLLGDGQVLVAGSVSSAAVGITADLYDPASDRWSPTASMTVDRNWHTATLLPCGEVLVVGGQTAGSTVLRSAERYNPKTKTWRLTGSLVTGRWKHTATLLPDGRVLVTGGWNGGELASAELYDPASETWSVTAGPMATARYHHLATLLPSGRVLIAGGFNLASAELFSPATGTFSPTGSAALPIGFEGSATLLPNGRVLVLPGFFPPGPGTSTVYDPAANSWTSGPAVVPDRDTHAATLLLNGRVLVVGGSAAPTTSTIFDIGRGELAAWRPAISAFILEPLEIGSFVFIVGTGFQGLGEGSSGLGYMHSATNYPLLQLRRLDNDQVRWLPTEPTLVWNDTEFTSTRLYGFASGPVIATVFANGIPSVSRGVMLECPPPNIDVPPASASVCAGSSAVFSVTATAPGSDCPSYRWRRNGVLLSEAAPFSGTTTPTLTVSPATLSEAGVYTVEVSLACSSTVVTSAPATLTVNAAMGAVDASISGPASVCTTCLGGTLSEVHAGGGAVTYQWGYRTTSGGATTDIPFATSPTYVLNGADFPAQANYWLVVRVAPACGAVAFSDEVSVTVSNTAGPANEVPFFTVTSRDSQNVLEWVYPTAYNKVRIRYTSGAPCVYPANGDTGGSFLMDVVGIAGARDGIPHNGVGNGTTYCYTIFVDTTGGGVWSAGKTNSGTPFATGGPLKWAFHSGMFSTTAPTVGGAGVIAVNNDNAVHAMTRGAAGGEWPAGWKPVKLGGAVQNRSPIVPITVGSSNPVAFLGAQDGNLYAVDATTGAAAAAPWRGAGSGRWAGAGGAGGPFHGFRWRLRLPARRHARGGRRQRLQGLRPGRRQPARQLRQRRRCYRHRHHQLDGGRGLRHESRLLHERGQRDRQREHAVVCAARQLAGVRRDAGLGTRPRQHRERAGAARGTRVRRQHDRGRHALLDRRRHGRAGQRPHLPPRRRAGQGLRVPRPQLAHWRPLLRHQHAGLGRDRDRRGAREQVRRRYRAAGRCYAVRAPVPPREPFRLRRRQQRLAVPDRHAGVAADGRLCGPARCEPAHARRALARHRTRTRPRRLGAGDVLRVGGSGGVAQPVYDELPGQAGRRSLHHHRAALHADVRRGRRLRPLRSGLGYSTQSTTNRLVSPATLPPRLRREHELLAVGREHREAVEAGLAGDPLEAAAVVADQVDVEGAAARVRVVAREDDALAVGVEVGREGGRTEIRQLPLVAAVRVHQPHLERRPGGRGSARAAPGSARGSRRRGGRRDGRRCACRRARRTARRRSRARASGASRCEPSVAMV